MNVMITAALVPLAIFMFIRPWMLYNNAKAGIGKRGGASGIAFKGILFAALGIYLGWVAPDRIDSKGLAVLLIVLAIWHLIMAKLIRRRLAESMPEKED